MIVFNILVEHEADSCFQGVSIVNSHWFGFQEDSP